MLMHINEIRYAIPRQKSKTKSINVDGKTYLLDHLRAVSSTILRRSGGCEQTEFKLCDDLVLTSFMDNFYVMD